ncbi:MAG: ATPase, T2SS/T4P/T4SS family [Planctomycetota bacterium]
MSDFVSMMPPAFVSQDPFLAKVLARCDQLDMAAIAELYEQVGDTEDFEAALLRHGLIQPRHIAQAYSEHYLVPLFDPPDESFDWVRDDVAALLTLDFCQTHRVLPLEADDNTIEVAIESPDALRLADDVRFHCARQMRPMFATAHVIDAGLARLRDQADRAIQVEQSGPTKRTNRRVTNRRVTDRRIRHGRRASDHPSATIFNPPSTLPFFESETPGNASGAKSRFEPCVAFRHLVAWVIQHSIADVHVRAVRGSSYLRCRSGGTMTELSPLQGDQSFIEQLRRETHWTEGRNSGWMEYPDGSIPMRIVVKRCDLVDGESWRLKFLRGDGATPTLADLELGENPRAELLRAIHRGRGLTLVTGPANSGKFETLRACLRSIHDPSLNAFAVQRQVDWPMENVSHLATDDMPGFPMHRAIDLALDQSADILLVRQIRDSETAIRCFRAALAGHRVLTSIASADMETALAMCRGFGLSGEELAESLQTIVAQRKLRVLCQDCKSPTDVDPKIRHRLGISLQAKLMGPVGCPSCLGTGYRGETTLYVVSPIDSKRRRVFRKTENFAQAIENDMRSLHDQAIACAVAGRTSLAEVKRVL